MHVAHAVQDTTGGGLASIRRAVVAARRVFRAFRRTRPFWGGLWLLLGGIVVIRVATMPLGMAIGGGWNASAGYILGGAMIMFALVSWFAPFYSTLCGLMGVFLALAAFISANLGGLLLGSILGIIGGAMVWGWGEKKSDRLRRRRRQKSAGDA